MDKPKKKNKTKQRLIVGMLGITLIGCLAAITVGFSSLKKAPPSVEERLLWIEPVSQGEFIRHVRGNGTLVPKEEWWIPAPGEGQIKTIHILPGEKVLKNTIILTIYNPILAKNVREAEWLLKASEAETTKLNAQLETQLLDKEDTLVTIKAELTVAKMKTERDQQLYDDGIMAKLELDTSMAKEKELVTRVELAKKSLVQTEKSNKAHLAVQEATVEQLRDQLELRQEQLEDLQVKSPTDGILQQMLVEPGQQVTSSTSLAKIAKPDTLKAELKIAETQSQDLALGLPVEIDTRNGLIPGKIQRIDPSVVDGSVLVEVELTGELPRSARPDLTVEGTIELERVSNVLFTGRPVQGRENGLVSLFRLTPDGAYAEQVDVRIGRSSVNVVEIISGLKHGDHVVLSDMTKWQQAKRIKLK
jgi:RND family efflux transporter MFP subunit